MSNSLGTNIGGLTAPGSDWVDITPSDSTDLTGVRAIWVGGAGDLTVVGIAPGATAHIIHGVAAGSLIPGLVKYVKAATTATLLTGFL